MKTKSTSDSTMRDVCLFALPMLAGNVLQSCYTMADMAIVGRFAGREGLAAISNTAMLCFIANSLCFGFSVGGNGAGKSTFLNIVMGLLELDAGTIAIDGQEVRFATPAEAIKAGVAIITQELSPIPGLTVAENIYLGREPMALGGTVVNYPALFAKAQRLLDDLRFPVNARSVMSELSLAHTQLVEIAKAISHNGRILIMDEPTTAIGEAETEILFDAIRSLKKQNVGIVYVSHRLTEIFASPTNTPSTVTGASSSRGRSRISTGRGWWS